MLDVPRFVVEEAFIFGSAGPCAGIVTRVLPEHQAALVAVGVLPTQGFQHRGVEPDRQIWTQVDPIRSASAHPVFTPRPTPRSMGWLAEPAVAAGVARLNHCPVKNACSPLELQDSSQELAPFL